MYLLIAINGNVPGNKFKIYFGLESPEQPRRLELGIQDS